MAESVKVLIRGAGDLASGIALRLFHCGFQVVMTEIPVPTTVRRTVAFSPAVYRGEARVEDVCGIRCGSKEVVECALENGKIAITVGEYREILHELKPDVVIDAILAKRNLGTSVTDAPVVVGVGPGFTAGTDCHCVVETKRGHDLGRCIWEGGAIPNTGVPGIIGGYGLERLLRAPGPGTFHGVASIGDTVKAGDVVAYAGDMPVKAQIGGVLRGLLQDGVEVTPGMKAGDIDPRCEKSHCFTVSDKARAVAGGVLEAILTCRNKDHRRDNREPVGPVEPGRPGKPGDPSEPGEPRVALVLLAAGDSRRFGGNKLLEEIGGKPMYRHIVDELAGLPAPLFYRKAAVSQYGQILEDLAKEGYEPVENSRPGLGISHSIQLALKQLGGEADAICFAVCDQPWLKGSTIAALIKAWAQSGKPMGCLHCHGRAGNPAVFSRAYEPALWMLEGDTGGRKILNRFPEDVYLHEINNPRELEDIDTPPPR